MKAIAFSGTLDPITNGHMWVIGEARALAEQVTIFLSENPNKTTQFSAEERKRIVELSAAENGWDNVRVVVVKGDYTARVAKKNGISYLIRGIRNTSDFDYENLIQQTNVDVLQGAKTIFVMPPRDLGSVSSSFVRLLQGPVGWHWKMKKFVPRPAYHAWILDWLRKDWQALWQRQKGGQVPQSKIDHWFSYLTSAEAYDDANRHYHNLEHLVHGLTELKVWASRSGAAQADVDMLKKAFWFHDAIYGEQGGDVRYEEASARLWLGARLDDDTSEEIADLIRVTDHFKGPSISHPLKQVMLCADLAILGQDQDIYDGFAAGIRNEYQHIAPATYAKNRRKALLNLSKRAEEGTLYADPYFVEQYNETALENMARELAMLNPSAL